MHPAVPQDVEHLMYDAPFRTTDFTSGHTFISTLTLLLSTYIESSLSSYGRWSPILCSNIIVIFPFQVSPAPR